MILILGYNKAENEFLNQIFVNNNIDYKYSLSEAHILKAEKVILPQPTNFNSTYRRMNMMNLFSMLRMIKKPILGISNGFSLMCNQLLNSNQCGMGLFNIDVNINKENFEFNDFDEGTIIIKDNCKLLSSLKKDNVHFNSKTQQEVFDCSKIVINSNDKNYSLLYEYNDFYGLEIDMERNQQISTEIITKFLES